MLSSFIGLILVLAFGTVPNESVPNPEASDGQSSSRPATTLAPGIVIDWNRPQVVVDATVIMRQGLIELFACSPGIREHESIVRIEARPTHLYQALGMIGLDPGHPLFRDPQTDTLVAATGDSLMIDVRCGAEKGAENGAENDRKPLPIESWLARSSEPARPLTERLDWVFAGSMIGGDQTLAVEQEGTVIALVDFSSALIALPELHTADNQALWLEPCTPAIPEVGSRCQLLIRPGSINFYLDDRGRLFNRQAIYSIAQMVERIKRTREHHPDRSVKLTIARGCPELRRQMVLVLLESGIAEVEIEVATVGSSADLPEPPTAIATRPTDGSEATSTYSLGSFWYPVIAELLAQPPTTEPASSPTTRPG